MKKKHTGFTLVELMITIAMLGILASLAVPAYRDYATRAKLTEVIVMAENMKKIVAESFADGHPIHKIGGTYDIESSGGAGLPRTRADLINSSFYDSYETSQYISHAWIEGGNVIIMLSSNENSGLPSDLRGGFLSLLAYHNDPAKTEEGLLWKCTSFNIPYRYLPNTCRNNLIQDINDLRPSNNL